MIVSLYFIKIWQSLLPPQGFTTRRQRRWMSCSQIDDSLSEIGAQGNSVCSNPWGVLHLMGRTACMPIIRLERKQRNLEAYAILQHLETLYYIMLRYYSNYACTSWCLIQTMHAHHGVESKPCNRIMVLNPNHVSTSWCWIQTMQVKVKVLLGYIPN